MMKILAHQENVVRIVMKWKINLIKYIKLKAENLNLNLWIIVSLNLISLQKIFMRKIKYKQRILKIITHIRISKVQKLRNYIKRREQIQYNRLIK